jgi:hypothetical protein
MFREERLRGGSLLGLGLLAACGCSGASADYAGFVEASVHAWCQNRISCGLMDPAFESGCEQYLMLSLGGALVAKALHVTYDSKAARADLDAIAGTPCVDVDWLLAMPCVGNGSVVGGVTSGCQTAVKGQVAEGGECQDSADCISESCSSSTGTCLPSPVLPGGAGTGCSNNGFCRKPLVCDPASGSSFGQCGARPGAGEHCRFDWWVGRSCTDGLICDGSVFPAVCAPEKQNGEACFSVDACGPRLMCIDLLLPPALNPMPGSCSPPIGAGGSCDVTRRTGCLYGLACVSPFGSPVSDYTCTR